MGFYSEAVYYRPGEAPVVTAKEVGAFLQKLLQTDFIKASRLSSADINWGAKITSDVRPFFDEQPVNTTTYRQPWWKRLFRNKPRPAFTTSITTLKSIDPDFSCDGDFDELIVKLLSQDGNIGRLNIVGGLTEEQYQWFQGPHPSGEQLNFRPDSWSLQFGEIGLHSITGWDLTDGETISEVVVGMMAFSIHGYGYFYPWEFRDWIEKFCIGTPIQEVCSLLRLTWPVTPAAPSADMVKIRRECTGLWPYDKLDAPLGWAWGPSES